MSEKKIIAGRYELGDLLGRGGMGDVYRGMDRQTGDPVAIKLLHAHIIQDNPQIVDRFKREGEALRQLGHPNIVQVLDAIDEGDAHYLVMEYVSGGSLRALIDEMGRLPIDRVLNIALDLADALTRAHRLNIIHRDLKPDNVLLAEDGTPRLTDFGVAHLGDRTRLTQTGSVIGTYAYLSPEACNGMELDERTDIWSFGILLYEMLAGRVPFEANSTAAILTAILTKPAPDLHRLRPDTPPGLLQLIYSMLEKDRDRRIASVRLVGAELEALMRGLDTPMREQLAAHTPPGERSRFATPSDQGADDVPAMAGSPDGQTHGLSVYPSAPPAPPPPSPAQLPPTPGTGETIIDTSGMWKWIAVMVSIVVLACSGVMVVGILFGNFGQGEEETDGGAFAPQVVEPVGPDEYMVLIADLEPIDTGERDISRYIAEDLTDRLTEDIAYSNVRVRRVPQVITTSDEAQAVAARNDATVVIWGHYTAEAVTLELRVGTMTAFPQMQMGAEIIARTANVRLQMTDPQTQSVAPEVASVMAILHAANSSAFEFMRMMAILDTLDVEPVSIQGSDVAAHVHRYFVRLHDDPQGALDAIEQAIENDPQNPFVYVLEGLVWAHLDQPEQVAQKAETAARAATQLDQNLSSWSIPQYMLAAGTPSIEQAIGYYTTIIAMRPDDWFALFFRGAVYYELQQYAQAQADIQAAIALEPNANFPYVYAALLALREGRIDDAGAHINAMLTQFPDPAYMNRLIHATLGEGVLSNYGNVLSAFTNLVLRDYEAVIEDTTRSLQLNHASIDLAWMRGMAYCAQRTYEAAESDYTRAIEHDPDFLLAYLLRADVRRRQYNYAGADDDFAVIRGSDQGDAFQPMIRAIRAGDLGCDNFFTAANPLLAPADAGAPDATTIPPTPDDRATATPEPTALPAALADIAPVGPDEYMVLVADLQPRGDTTRANVSDVVADDLTNRLEQDIPFSNLRVRRYPAVIDSDDEAQAIAEAVGAPVVVWGNYDDDVIELNIQPGALADFPYMAYSRAELAAVTNVRAHISDIREQSAARLVLNVLNMLAAAEGDEFGFLYSMAEIGYLDVIDAEPQGSSLAATMHRALLAYTADTAQALDLFAQAVEASAHPLAFFYRGMAHLRSGDLRAFDIDIGTAQIRGPDNWLSGLMMSPTASFDEALRLYDQVIILRPEDWYPHFLRGIMYYQWQGNLDAARADLAQSIALDPPLHLPHLPAVLIALREGRSADAQALVATIREKYPDAQATNRAMQAVYGNSPHHRHIGAFFAASTNLALKQYTAVLEQTDTALIPDGDGAADDISPIGIADLLLVRGLAQCNLGEDAAAEASYTRALDLTPDFPLLHILRAQVRQAQGDASGAAADFAAAQEHTLGTAFDAWLAAAQAGEWDCQNLLD